jgi:hypothetical protein
MEPMSVDRGGCSGLDAQIEQLMQCRPLAEQEVRSCSAMNLRYRSVRDSVRPVPISWCDLVYAELLDLLQGVLRVSQPGPSVEVFGFRKCDLAISVDIRLVSVSGDSVA